MRTTKEYEVIASGEEVVLRGFFVQKRGRSMDFGR